MSPQISQLFVYPIKSCAGISVSSFQFDEKGPLFDRRWMLVDSATGVFLSQREVPQLALISTRIEDGQVWASQLLDKTIAEGLCLNERGELIDVQVWSDDVRGYDCGDEAANWFSQVLNRSCRLVYQGDCLRFADEEYADKGTNVGFADGFPLLVVAQSSIDFLNDACEAEISAVNFRPNIVVENSVVFAERNWQSLTASGLLSDANLEMTVVKSCERCVIPALNPNTAKREPSILPVLLKYCRREKKIHFGQNLTFNYFDKLEVKVGQALTITEKAM
ncbi:MAG: MOSC N-terminal beta barrel domain-containing protein [Oleispira sp.]